MPAPQSADFYSAPTAPLAPAAVSPAPEPKPVPRTEEKPTPNPQKRKVSVRAKAASNPELEETIAKLTALSPESQKIIRQLIDQLSQ